MNISIKHRQERENVKMKTDLGLIALFGLFFTLVLFLSSCKKSESSTGSQEKTTFNMRMTDAPGDYDAVNVEVIGAEVHSDVDGWVALNVTPGIYNLLDLTNGKDTLIGSGQVAVGTVSQIRLILGSNNTIVVDSQVYPLKTPSAEQSGLKLQVHAQLVKGVNYTMLIDFDADKSIVVKGNGDYSLKPVLRVITNAVDGAIKGFVLPVTAQATVVAVNGTDSFSTNADVITGGFFIGGLSAGTYQVLILPNLPFGDTAVNNVSVSTGLVSDIGIVTVQ